MPMPQRPRLTVEERLAVLEADKLERDQNERQTEDRRSHEIVQAVKAAVAAVTAPRFERADATNDEQLRYLREQEVRGVAAEQERLRRAAREEVIREQKEREDVARAVRDADRKHSLKIWGVVVAILAVVGPVVAATIASQFTNAHSAVPPIAPPH